MEKAVVIGCGGTKILKESVMKRKKLLLYVTVLFFVTVTTASASEVIFDNYGPGDTYNTGLSYIVNDTFDEGMPFTTPSSSELYVDTIELTVALNTVLGGNNNELDVSLMTDFYGKPGTVIETITISGQMPILVGEGPYSPILGTSVLKPLLEPNTQYWLVASTPVPGTHVVWYANSVGQTGRALGQNNSWLLLSNDATGVFRINSIPTSPVYSCSGFEPPMDNGAVTVKKNRALPLKAQLLDETGTPLTDADIIAAPVIQVMFQPQSGTAIDVTDDALPVGLGTDGNEFVYTGSNWQYNLKTHNYTASGTYTIIMVSGDESEYVIDPTCEAVFVIE